MSDTDRYGGYWQVWLLLAIDLLIEKFILKHFFQQSRSRNVLNRRIDSKKFGSMFCRSCTITDNLESVGMELRSCREALERAVCDRDNFQRQAANHLLALDRVKQVSLQLQGSRLGIEEKKNIETRQFYIEKWHSIESNKVSAPRG